MKRADIEQMMKQQGKKFISLVYKETDPLGMLCEMKSGYLCDYTGHRVDRTMDIWGTLEYKDFGKGYKEPYKVKFEK